MFIRGYFAFVPWHSPKLTCPRSEMTFAMGDIRSAPVIRMSSGLRDRQVG
jgi:hypothetical protein